MKNKAFGLDVGTTTTKAVWLSKEKNGFLLDAVLNTPTPEKGMLSDASLDQTEMSNAIRQMMDAGKLGAEQVHVALPESQIYTKVIEMPVLSDKELSSAIYWEAEQYIPIPLSGVTLDYQVLSRPEKNSDIKTMDVLLVGAPTTLIDRYEKILTLAGLTVASIETEILSIIRAVIPVHDSPSSIIAHVGSISTSLAIVRNGILAFTYSVPTGGIAISRAISADFGLTLSQAEQYKKSYGLTGRFDGKIGKATEPVLESVLIEIKKAQAYFEQKYPGTQLKQLILSGGSARLPGLNSFFANRMGIETVSANPWKILVNQEVPKEIIDNAQEYTIAVGLAMREDE